MTKKTNQLKCVSSRLHEKHFTCCWWRGCRRKIAPGMMKKAQGLNQSTKRKQVKRTICVLTIL
ncbi:hypothetical protein O9993_22725 [Vibrio lentus]|nr:hypothetical protein [Vibrio lentus]